jgi:hypothetical protein
MGLLRRLREGIHRYTCDTKLGPMMHRRARQLRQRGLTEDQSKKQAEAELIQFLEMFHLDPTTAADILFAEKNFPLFTNSQDSKKGV